MSHPSFLSESHNKINKIKAISNEQGCFFASLFLHDYKCDTHFNMPRIGGFSFILEHDITF